MTKTFKCNFYKETDKIEIDRNSRDIALRPSGEEHGKPWKGLIYLKPEDAVDMANHLKQLASELGVEEPEVPCSEDMVEVTSMETVQTKVTAEQIDEIMRKAKVLVSTEFEKCTVVTVKLPNGFTITESSGCVDVANYDVKLGTEICLKKIRNKVWELEGYALQKRLSDMGVL